MAYLLGIGWNVPLVNLVALNPQPRTKGLQVTQRDFAASGAVADQGRYIEFEYSAFDDVAEYQALLTQFNVLTNLHWPVTVYCQDAVFNWVRRNGMVMQPQIGVGGARGNFFLRDFTILVKNLRLIV